MTPGWLAFHPDPSVPRFRVPPGAVDAHCHVFGPGSAVPVRAGAQVHAVRRVEGPALRAARPAGLRAQRRSSRRPATAPTTARWSTRCGAADGRARGVATVRRGVTDAELAALHAAGVRGTRFNFVKRLVDFTPRDELLEIAQRIAPLGWHVVVYFEAADLPELIGLLHRAADHRRRRPHGTARRDQAGRRAASSSSS